MVAFKDDDKTGWYDEIIYCRWHSLSREKERERVKALKAHGEWSRLRTTIRPGEMTRWCTVDGTVYRGRERERE